mmetsp:Transcript_32265/g.111027  ORF Transcript_32265/g.111027 Transcript_32265/m.111027 type:complete len:581 (-) Transcript_32265:267-2009(-)
MSQVAPANGVPKRGSSLRHVLTNPGLLNKMLFPDVHARRLSKGSFPQHSIDAGAAKWACDKDEDSQAGLRGADGETVAFLVTDGHGGSRLAAEIVARELLPRLLEGPAEDAFTEEHAASAFIAVDEEIGYKTLTAGATATALLLRRNVTDAPGSVDVFCAWVGDSRCAFIESLDGIPSNEEELSASNGSDGALAASVSSESSLCGMPQSLESVATAGDVSPRMNGDVTPRWCSEVADADLDTVAASISRSPTHPSPQAPRRASAGDKPLSLLRHASAPATGAAENAKPLARHFSAPLNQRSPPRSPNKALQQRLSLKEARAASCGNLDGEVQAVQAPTKGLSGLLRKMTPSALSLSLSSSPKASDTAFHVGGPEALAALTDLEARKRRQLLVPFSFDHSLCGPYSHAGELARLSALLPQDVQASALSEFVLDAQRAISESRGEFFNEKMIAHVKQRFPPRLASRLEKRGRSKQRERTTLVGCFWDSRTSSVFQGPSLQMSRSLGDWDSAHCCIPTPEVRWGTVPAGDRAVFVMASDGVWDVVDMDKAAKVVRKYAPSGLAAARALVDYARSKYTASSKKR